MLSDGPTRRARVLHLVAERPDPRALGGVAVHVAALLEKSRAVPAAVAYAEGGELKVETARREGLAAVLPWGPTDDRTASIAAALSGTESTVLHVHSPSLGPREIARAKERAGAALVVSLHDHALACENYDLLENGERFCGVPEDEDRCRRCLTATLGRGNGALAAHRDAMRALVTAADAFVSPSESVLSLVARAHPEVRERARRIDWGVPPPSATKPRESAARGPLQVAIVGVLAKEKGRARLPALLAACRDLDAQFHVFGATGGASLGDVRSSAPRVRVHGAYRRSALAGRLVGAGAQVVVLPSIKPETWSLVLGEVVAAGFPVVTSDFGALAERVAREGLGFTFDPWAPETLRAVLASLADDRTRLERIEQHLRTRRPRSEADMLADHEALWTAVTRRDVAAKSGDEAGRALYERGQFVAKQQNPSPLLRLARAVRASDFYRDLPLRRVLREETRRIVEESIARWLTRLTRPGRR